MVATLLRRTVIHVNKCLISYFFRKISVRIIATLSYNHIYSYYLNIKFSHFDKQSVCFKFTLYLLKFILKDAKHTNNLFCYCINLSSNLIIC